MKISKEIPPLAYELSKKVFEGTLTVQEGLNQLVGNNRMNLSSASYYINNFRCMLEGRKFTRTNNALSMEYFFDNIYNDYGSKGLTNALLALRLHIEYYEGNRKVVMHKMREILNRYSVHNSTRDEEQQKEIVEEIKNQQKSRQDIIDELNNLNPFDSIEVKINGKKFQRDNKTIAQIKILRDFKCQICSTTIKKKDGTLYVEAAHIEAKFKKGRETPDNILLLCPNHHKEFDLGQLLISQHTKESIQFTLNEIEYTISLKIN